MLLTSMMQSSSMLDRRTLLARWFLLLLALWPTAYAVAQQEVLKAPSSAVPSTYFGIHNIRFHSAVLRPNSAFGSWRLWDTGTSWADLQSDQDAWNFSRLDFAVSVSRQLGYSELILTLGRTPSWASQRPTEKSFYGPGAAAPPRNIADFRNYVRTVAKRYKGRIQWYEIWNEPASGGMYTGTIEQMVQLTQAASEEVRAEDPAARVICPSPAKLESLDWYDRFLRAGGAKSCDILGYHFYTDSAQPEERIRVIRRVQDLLGKHGLRGLPLWDTESGISLGRERPRNVASNESHVARWLLLTWASGIERFYWYAWDHDDQGFIHPDGTFRSSAAQAYRQVQKWMLGSRFDRCERNGVVWTCYLTRENGQTGRIAWTSDNSLKHLDIGARSTVEELAGQQLRPVTSSTPVTGSPVWISDN